MPRELVVNYPPYHHASVKPQSFEGFCEMYETHGRITGLWDLKQWNPRTGEIVKEIWAPNVVTDIGAQNILQRAINSSSATLPNLFNNLLITNNSGSTTLTTALSNGQTGITSLAVAAVPAAIPSGTTLQLGYGTGTTQNVTTSGTTSQGATSITVSSFTASAAFAIGTAVVPVPQVTDNPNNAGLTSNASSPLSQYSGNLSTGAFTFTPNTGAGNRMVVVTFVFANSTNGGTTSNGSYTDCWIVNVNTGATTNNYVAHEINTPMRCDNNNSVTATVTIKI